MNALEDERQTVFLRAINGQLVCTLSVTDTIKPETTLTICTLRNKLDLDVILLTDHKIYLYSINKVLNYN
jgi:cation transport ATPase